MPFVAGIKFACAPCIKGHRSANCPHGDRPLLEIKKKGRPSTQCERCHALRREKSLHVKCVCVAKTEERPRPLELPNGLPAGPLLPTSPVDTPPVVRAKSIKRPSKAHDLDHGHHAHHVATSYSPYHVVAPHALARSNSTSSRSSLSTPPEPSPFPLPSLPLSLDAPIPQVDSLLSFPFDASLEPFDDTLVLFDTALDLLDTSGLDGRWDLTSFFPSAPTPPPSASSLDPFPTLDPHDPLPALDFDAYLAGAWSASSLENGWTTPELENGGWTSEEGASGSLNEFVSTGSNEGLLTSSGDLGIWEEGGTGIDRWRSELRTQDWATGGEREEGLGCEGYAVV